MQGVTIARSPDIAELVRTYQAEIWRYLRFLGCESTLAEDLTQDTFLAVFRRPFQDFGRSATSAYLRTVARNLFLSSVRRSRSAPQVVDLEEAERVWARYESEDQGASFREFLRECEEELPEKDRQAIRLRYRDKCSRESMAGMLELSAEGVKTLLRRIRDRLRLCIEGKMSHE